MGKSNVTNLSPYQQSNPLMVIKSEQSTYALHQSNPSVRVDQHSNASNRGNSGYSNTSNLHSTNSVNPNLNNTISSSVGSRNNVLLNNPQQTLSTLSATATSTTIGQVNSLNSSRPPVNISTTTTGINNNSSRISVSSIKTTTNRNISVSAALSSNSIQSVTADKSNNIDSKINMVNISSKITATSAIPDKSATGVDSQIKNEKKI